MKKIKLTKGKVTLVDDADFEYLNQWKWYFLDNRYAARISKRVPGKSRGQIRMHRVIMCPPEGKIVDHINGNGLDNQRENLRLVTNSENMMNRPKQANNKSGFKGVFLDKKTKKWKVAIMAGGKYLFRGLFEDIKDAAKMYNKMARKIHGKFARLNKI